MISLLIQFVMKEKTCWINQSETTLERAPYYKSKHPTREELLKKIEQESLFA